MAIKFFDTNALMSLQEKAFENKFVCSHKTLQEIEAIKTSNRHDEETKYKARNLSRIFKEHDNYIVCNYNYTDIIEYINNKGLEIAPDNIILAEADIYKVATDNDLVFVTNDISCANIARNVIGLQVESTEDNRLDDYLGYKEVVVSDEELAGIYQNMGFNKYDSMINEYLILRNTSNEVIDTLKWNGTNYVPTKKLNIKSRQMGTIKPLDVYQELLFDSLYTNKITMVKGDSGTGKSLISLGYLLTLLEKRKIDRIVIFCNTVATTNSAKLGFYPGTREEKLQESSIGNMLAAKLGDSIELERMLGERKIQLLPMCDIRGYDTSGMNCGVYITEAQNLDITLMKLALQRIGEDSICIIDGDYRTQVDMAQYAGNNNGMRRMSQVFRGENIYGEVELKKIYRSRIADIANRM